MLAYFTMVWDGLKLVARFPMRYRELGREVATLKEDVGDLRRQLGHAVDLNGSYSVQLEEYKAHNDTLRHENGEYRGFLETEKRAGRRLRNQVTGLERQIHDVADSDGKIWEREAAADVPRFVPRRDRRAIVVSVVNLKGGVGKTTVTANLGATLASLGQQVLLVDLDHQASLTELCFAEQKQRDLRTAGRVIDNLFQRGGASARHFAHAVERVDSDPLFVVGADEALGEHETQAMATWLVKPDTPDARFLLRSVLHSPKVADAYDWVLLDCPPRLTTACINALAASDYVLIPVILDLTSVNAVPRMLHWLAKLKDVVCVDLSIFGVLANKTQYSGSLTTAETGTWETLQAKCASRWESRVYYFDQFVPRSTEFAQAAKHNTFAAASKKLRSRFLDLADEFRGRLPVYES